VDGQCIDAGPPAPPTDTTAEVGTLDGSFSVTDAGQAQYNISIAVPPGRAGMQPDIGLVYTSDKKLGPAGIGWRITGFSAIARCATRAEFEGPRAVRYDTGDRLCLDGKRLIAHADGTYRTEVDQFSKITVTLENGHPKFFKVYTKAGTILTYGGTEDSSVFHWVQATQIMVKRAWGVSRVEDRNGNVMKYTYETRHLVDGVGDVATATVHDVSEMVPMEVAYAENGNWKADRGVRLVYKDIAPRALHYASGGTSTIQRQLDYIETYVRGTVARRYRFDYVDRGLVFLLKEAKECVPRTSGPDLCKPPTAFEYDNDPAFGPAIPQTAYSTVPLAGWSGSSADLDGDGDDEWFLQGGAYNTDAMTQGIGRMVVDLNDDGKEEIFGGILKGQTKIRVKYGPPPHDPADNNYGLYQIPPGPWVPDVGFPADIDGDGRKDIVVCRGPDLGYITATADSGGNVTLSPVQALQTTVDNQPASWGQCDGVPLLVDFDDDGVVNLLRPQAPGSHNWRALVMPANPSESPAWVPIRFYEYSTDQYRRVHYRTLDANGDGLVDIWGTTLWINQGDGNFRKATPTYPGNIFPPGRHLFFDIDGDGNDDILGEHGEARWLPPTLTLHYETTPAITPPTRFEVDGYNEVYNPFLADTNGDGDLDLIEVRGFQGCRNEGHGEEPKTGCPAQIRHGHSRRKHLLKSVVDGVGRKVEIFYNGQERVTPGNCAGQPNLLCPRKFPPLVGEHRFSIAGPSANPNPRKIYEYSYGDARAGTNGRGSYGFGQRTIKEFDGLEHTVGRGPLFATTEIEYHNREFALAGLLKKRTVTTGQLSQGVAGFVQPARRGIEETFTYEKIEFGASGERTLFPALRQSTKTVFDWLDGAGARAVVSTEVNDFTDGALGARYDKHGNSKYHHRKVYAGNDTDPLVAETLTIRHYKPSDVANWLVGLVERTEISDKRGAEEIRVWTYEYDDASGRLTRRTRDPDGAFRQVEEFSYEDPVKNLTRRVLQPGNEKQRSVTIDYDAASLTFPRYTTNALGHGQTTTVDPRHGGLISSVDHNGLTETRTYDAFGRLTKVEGPSGTMRITLAKGTDDPDPFPPPDPRAVMRVLTEELSTSGQDVGAMKVEDFGPRGEILKRDVTGYQTETHADQWVEETFTYDHVGRLKAQTRPHPAAAPNDQGEIQLFYDDTGELIEEKYPGDPSEGGPTSVYHASATRHTWLDEDAAGYFGDFGVRVGVVSQRVHSTEGAAAGLAVGSRHVVDPDGLIVTARDAADTFTDYAYGPFRQLGRVEVGRDQGVQTTIEYFPYGRKMRHTDPDTGVETYDLYDAFDQLKEVTDARGVTKKFDYDALGRMTEALAFVPELPEASEKTTWDYDGVDGEPVGPNEFGRLVQVRSGSGAVPNRHVTRYFYQAGNTGLLQEVDRTIGDASFATAFSYDDFNRVELIQYPIAGNAFAVRRTYDQRGNLIKVSDASPPNTPYWQVTATSQGYRIASETFGNNAVTTTEYDPFSGRLEGLRTASQAQNGVVLQDFSYEYTPNGNLKRRENTSAPRIDQFRYDELDRLTHTTRDNQQEVQVATYDPRGNIKTKVGVGTYNYVHPTGVPRPVHAPRTVTNGGAPRTFLYDPSGNEVERTGGPEGTRTTEYTSFNLPTVITDALPAQLTTTFEYDGDHTRVIKTESTVSGQRTTVYAGSLYERVTDHTSGTAVVTHKYRIFAEGKQVAQLERTQGELPNTVYLHGDHLGSVQLITKGEPDSSSNLVVHEQIFDPWGKPEGTAAWDGAADPRAHNVRTGFTGHEHDPGHSLINMRGRIYDPELGRFMTADPIVQAPFYSQSYNRYAYVFNNPLRYTDPSGFAGIGGNGPAEQPVTSGKGDGKPKINEQPAPITVDTITPSAGSSKPGGNSAGADTGKQSGAATPKSESDKRGGGGPGTGGGGGVPNGPTKNQGQERTGVSPEQVRADVERAAMIVGSDNRDATPQRGATNSPGTPANVQAAGFASAASLGSFMNYAGNTLSKIRAAPTTGIGISIGLVGWAMGGEAPSIGNNAIEFTGNPLIAKFTPAVTIGNTILYTSRTPSLATQAHEQAHTIQAEALGSGYLPAHVASQVVGFIYSYIDSSHTYTSVNDRVHSPANLLETGPSSTPPRPWP
jgi:RHS repeat-associated protein